MDDLKEVDNLISQLTSTNVLNNVPKDEEEEPEEELDIDQENMEEFIIKNSAELIRNSNKLIKSISKNVKRNMFADDVSSLADLIGASVRATEVLNKLIIQNKKIKLTKEMTQLRLEDAAAARALNMGDQNNLQSANEDIITISRNELLKSLNESTKKTMKDKLEFIEAELISSEEENDNPQTETTELSSVES